MESYELTGMIRMWQAAGRKEDQDRFLASMDRLVLQDGTMDGQLPSQDAIALFYAWKWQGNRQDQREKYRKAMDLLAESKNPPFTLLPFLTAYDTAFRKKEHYSEIAGRFLEERGTDGDTLIAMVHTVEEMSQEIYEYYRQLRDRCKERLKESLKSPANPKIMYCVLKACGLRILQTEKYTDFIDRAKILEETPGVDSGAGIELMLKAQIILLKNKEV